jgi:2'-5' RNA ligase
MSRYFFALWPEAGAAKELARLGDALARLVGGKPMPVEKIHLTLAFLGSLGEDELGAAAAIARRLRGSPIAMSIDTVGCFRRAKVGWAAPSVVPGELIGLQSSLEGALRDAGFRLEERPFNPHVTLVRKIATPVPRAPTAAIEWRSGTFTLVESTGDGRYEVRESWGL